jgi:hypothetical protein
MLERNTIGGHTSSIGAAYTDAGISASFFLFFSSFPYIQNHSSSFPTSTESQSMRRVIRL